MRTEYLLAIVICLVVLPLSASAAVVRDEQMNSDAGDWNPIENVEDTNMVELAKFAVRRFNRAFEQRVDYQSILKGEKRIGDGTNYKFVIEVKDDHDNANKNYEFVVWEKPDAYSTKQVTSIKLLP